MKNGPYILIKPPEDYPGKLYRGKYAYEHQVVWWLHNKEIIKEPFIIHHKDENKHNNTIVNLEKKTRSKHQQEHHIEPKYIELICGLCKITFKKRHKQWTTKNKQGQKIFYCSRECVGKSNRK
jgi:hypothetical protein